MSDRASTKKWWNEGEACTRAFNEGAFGRKQRIACLSSPGRLSGQLCVSIAANRCLGAVKSADLMRLKK